MLEIWCPYFKSSVLLYNIYSLSKYLGHWNSQELLIIILKLKARRAELDQHFVLLLLSKIK